MVPVDENTENVTVTLKIEGKAQTDWEDIGLYLYQDEDNFVAIQRKYRQHYAVLGLVNEINQVASEQLGQNGSDIDFNSIYFKLVKIGSTVTAYYSENGVNWQQFGNAITNSTLSKGMKVAFGAMNNGNKKGSSFIFTDLYINNRHMLLTKNKNASMLRLANGITIDNPTNENWSIADENRIYAKATMGGTFQEQIPANWFKIPVKSDTTEVTLKIVGRAESPWEDAGLYLGKDADNYVAIQRKYRGSNIEVLGLVNEMNGSVRGSTGEQLETGSSILSNYNSIYFKLRRNGNTVTAYYSADAKTWIQYGNPVQNMTFATGNQLYAAFGVMNNGSTTDSSFVFTDLTVNGTPVPLTQYSLTPQV